MPARPSECPRGAGARAGACPRAAKERGAHPDGRPPRSPPARAAGSCVGPGAGGDARRSGLSMKGGARARQSRGWSDASGSGGEVRARAPGGRRSGTPLWAAPLALARGDSAGRRGSRSVLSGLRGWQDAGTASETETGCMPAHHHGARRARPPCVAHAATWATPTTCGCLPVLTSTAHCPPRASGWQVPAAGGAEGACALGARERGAAALGRRTF